MGEFSAPCGIQCTRYKVEGCIACKLKRLTYGLTLVEIERLECWSLWGYLMRLVEDICNAQREKGKEVWAVNYNTDGQIVIAGAKKDLEELVPVLKGAKAKRAMLLKYVVASPLSTFRECC